MDDKPAIADNDNAQAGKRHYGLMPTEFFDFPGHVSADQRGPIRFAAQIAQELV
jgi:hypothetical protein